MPRITEGGIFSSMPNEEYHTVTDWISKTGLDYIDKSPLAFKSKYLSGVHEPPTDAMIIGSAAHTLVLEPDTFHGKYLIVPDVRKNSKEYKEHAAKAEGREIIKQADFEMFEAIRDAIYRHDRAGKILEHAGMVEHSFFGMVDDVQVKCRPDWVNPDAGVCIDFKTAVSAARAEFEKSVGRFRYHVQDPFYCDVLQSCGIDVKEFYFIVVEKTPPYHVAVYWINRNDVSAGREAYKKNLRQYKWCLEHDDWFGYNHDEITEINVPGWALD